MGTFFGKENAIFYPLLLHAFCWQNTGFGFRPITTAPNFAVFLISPLMNYIVQAKGSLYIDSSGRCANTEAATMNDIFELEPFVVRNQKGTLSLDSQAAIANNKNAEAVAALQHHFETINQEIQSGQISTDEHLNIIGGEHIIKSHRCNLGKNSFTTFWWGYQRYACNCETRRIVSDLNTWAAGGTMAGGAATGVVIVFPVTAPIAGVIAAGAAFDAGYWWLLATRIDANNQGRGTITNMTNILIFDIIPQ